MMKRSPVTVFLALVIATLSNSPGWAASLKTYSNIRYGFAVTYPSDSVSITHEPDAGDGVEFAATMGPGLLAVWAASRDAEHSPEALVREGEDKCPDRHADYRLVKAKLIAVSCVTADKIFYQKSILSPDVVVTFAASYPRREKAAWDPIVTKMAHSLRFLNAEPQQGPQQ